MEWTNSNVCCVGVGDATHWIKKTVLHKPGTVTHPSDSDEFTYGPPLEVEGDYCV